MNRRTLISVAQTLVLLLATTLLLDLRLTGVVSWSWWWVLSLLWLPPAITILAFAALATRERWGAGGQRRSAVRGLQPR